MYTDTFFMYTYTFFMYIYTFFMYIYTIFMYTYTFFMNTYTIFMYTYTFFMYTYTIFMYTYTFFMYTYTLCMYTCLLYRNWILSKKVHKNKYSVEHIVKTTSGYLNIKVIISIKLRLRRVYNEIESFDFFWKTICNNNL